MAIENEMSIPLTPSYCLKVMTMTQRYPLMSRPNLTSYNRMSKRPLLGTARAPRFQAFLAWFRSAVPTFLIRGFLPRKPNQRRSRIAVTTSSSLSFAISTINNLLSQCYDHDMTTFLGRISSSLPPASTRARLIWPIGSGSTVHHTLLSRPFSYDHVVIGAGVVGLAVAAKLAESMLPSTCLTG